MRTAGFIRLFDISSKIKFNWMKQMMMDEKDIIRQGKYMAANKRYFEEKFYWSMRSAMP